MGMGFLRIELFAGDHDYPVTSDNIKILRDGRLLYTVKTDKDGWTEAIPLEAPCLADCDGYSAAPERGIYDVIVCGGGKYRRAEVHGVQIFDGQTSILPIEMLLLLPGENPEVAIDEIYIPYEHGAEMDKHQEGPASSDLPSHPSDIDTQQMLNAILVDDIALPDYVSVHLGQPNLLR